MNQGINDHVQRTNIAALAERLNGPEMVQTQRATRYPDATGIEVVYVAENATKSNHIRCFRKYDGTDPGVWSKRVFTDGEVIAGDDGKIYRCPTGYDATDDNDELTKPITGANYAAHWVVIEEIEVYCDITGGGNLEDARRHLLTMQKSIGYDALVLTSPPDTWQGPPETTPTTWSHRAVIADAIVIGDDSKNYRCKAHI